jgi:hypothetical protein
MVLKYLEVFQQARKKCGKLIPLQKGDPDE